MAYSVQCLDSSVPLRKPCIPVIRNSDLSELKQASTDAYSLWMMYDKPRSGLINRLHLSAKYKYKHAFKKPC